MTNPRKIKVSILGDPMPLAARLAQGIRCEQEKHDEITSRNRYLLKRRLRDLRRSFRRAKPCPNCGKKVI